MTSSPEEIYHQLKPTTGRRVLIRLKDGAGEARGYVDSCPENLVFLIEEDPKTHAKVRMGYPYGNIAGVGLLIG